MGLQYRNVQYKTGYIKRIIYDMLYKFPTIKHESTIHINETKTG